MAERLFWGDTGNGNVLGNPVFSFLICIDSTSLGYITTSNVSFLLNIFTFAYAHKYIQLPTCIFTCLLWKIPNAAHLKQNSSVFTPVHPYWPILPRCAHAQWCPALCGPKDCSPPDSSVHGMLQARILEWVALSFSNCLNKAYQF